MCGWVEGLRGTRCVVSPRRRFLVVVLVTGTIVLHCLVFSAPPSSQGRTTEEVQRAWLASFHGAGVKVLVSAFGSTDTPTACCPHTVATALAQFVRRNQLDGVDLDYEDNAAMEAGKGEAWVITCTRTLRQLLPAKQGYILTHAPQAPYFMPPPQYPGGGYTFVNQEVGEDIDW